MGTLKYFIFLFFCVSIYSQKAIVVKIENTDSIRLKKIEKEYYLRVYSKENIKFNKNLKKIRQVDGTTYCEGCKREYRVFVVKQVKNPKSKLRIIDVKSLLKNQLGFNGYFLLKDIYYENCGEVIN